MDKTGVYKGKGGNQNTGNTMERPKRQFNTDITNRTSTTGKGKGKAPAKRKPTQKNHKSGNAEMDRRKAEGACFYCGEKGHMTNEWPKKEDKSNHVRLCEEIDSSEVEYKAESDDREDFNGQNSIITFKTTVGQLKNKTKSFQALKFSIMVNGRLARALVDTETIGGTLLSNHFVTTNNITYKP